MSSLLGHREPEVFSDKPALCTWGPMLSIITRHPVSQTKLKMNRRGRVIRLMKEMSRTPGEAGAPGTSDSPMFDDSDQPAYN